MMSAHREFGKGSDTYRSSQVADLTSAVRAYIAHTEGGMGIRAIARLQGCQPSTVLRRIRRLEERRDDPLVDAALSRTAVAISHEEICLSEKEDDPRMSPTACASARKPSDFDATVTREARRILRRLCEKDAFLAVAEDMEKAVVLRESVPGRPTRTAVVDRDVAYHFALREWISCRSSARISRYEVTDAGRSALKRLLEEERQAREGQGAFAEKLSPFRVQHQEVGERRIMDHRTGRETRVRYNLAESPLTVLGRKRDRSGAPFLQSHMIDAGERLREDFELAQLGPRVTQNWESFLTPRQGAGGRPADTGAPSSAARDRVLAALTALGPGLSDVAFRVCCFLEGLETAEKRLGWSARSGKVVLKIALQRLAMHYGIEPAPAAGADRYAAE